ncbi:MAG: COQ9 family protein [Maritimibacter sp.]|nr:COQ9 family protein [Maritimibacter sp.]
MTTRDEFLDAAMGHAVFDGWSQATIEATAADLGIGAEGAKRLFPRGAVGLASAYHRRGDAQMVERLRAADLGGMRFRDRTAHAVRLRLELADKELVRRGMALFALPQNAATGARLIWETSDEIWTALGDTSKDYNWYTKRTTLAGVYSSTALYWLGDQSAENADTWAFLDRRIENVMQFEKVKAQVTKNPLVDAMLKGPGAVLDIVRAPRHSRGDAR